MIMAAVVVLCCTSVSAASQRIVYSWSSNAGPMNAHMYAPNQMFAQRMVFDPLVGCGHDGSPQPALAESWEISEDGRVYTFHMRPGVRFSDGLPCDAYAVALNFDAVMKHADRHSWIAFCAQIESWEAVDAMTFRLTMKNPYYPTLAELALIRPLRIMSPGSIPEDKDTAKGLRTRFGAGTGPWMLVDVKKGEYDLFRANPYYWGEKPSVDEVLIKVIPDSTARALAFDTGEIDIIYGAASGQIDMDTFVRYQNMPGVVTKISAPQSSRNLALNTGRFPTDDLRVRRAILHGVNKEALVKHVFMNVEHRSETLFSSRFPYCDIGLKPYAYDPERAAALLEEAGWKLPKGGAFRVKDGRTLSIDLCFKGNDALMKAVAEVLQGDMLRLGIDLRLLGEEADSYLKRQKTGEFGMMMANTWGAPYDPASFCSSMCTPSHADFMAQSGLAEKKDLDRKITDVMLTTDETVRQKLYAEILTLLHEQAVYLPLTYPTNIMVHRENLLGTEFGPMQYDVLFEKMHWRP